MSDPVEQFRAAISGAGLVPPKIVSPDGKLHRFASNGDARDKAGWYIFHLDGLPAGAFGDFRSGLDQTWRADIDRKLSPQELADCKARVESMRHQREAEDARVKAEARKEAVAIWDAARPAPDDHPYLAKKGIEPHRLRVHEGRLVVPMLDDQGTLHSLHYIAGDGSKRFLTGGRVAGCFYQIGEPRGVICVGEGFATMATVHEATGHAAVAAINKSSLLAVAQSFRKRFPAANLVLCADDDWMREGNPGMTDARAAAAAVGGVVAVPEFGEGRGDKDTDFNDMASVAGRDAVSACIQKALGGKPEGGNPLPVIKLKAGQLDLESHGDIAAKGGHSVIDDDRPEGISRAAWIEAKRRFRAEKAGAASNASGEKLSEDELALALVDRHGGALQYDAEIGKWNRWEMKKWVHEKTLALFDLARKTCRNSPATQEKPQ